MMRSAEQRVESSRRARELRDQGKNIWSKSIPMRAILAESRETSNERIADVAVRISKLMRASLPDETFDITHEEYDWNFNEAIEDFADYSTERLDLLEAEGEDVKAMFNGSLADIYDWADRTRVWLS